MTFQGAACPDSCGTQTKDTVYELRTELGGSDQVQNRVVISNVCEIVWQHF